MKGGDKMYILVIRKDKKVLFQKEFKNFDELMKKYSDFNFEKENLTYNIYRSMPVNEILREYLKDSDDLDIIKKELKDLLKDL